MTLSYEGFIYKKFLPFFHHLLFVIIYIILPNKFWHSKIFTFITKKASSHYSLTTGQFLVAVTLQTVINESLGSNLCHNNEYLYYIYTPDFLQYFQKIPGKHADYKNIANFQTFTIHRSSPTQLYTGCTRRTLPCFVRKFITIIYITITKHNCIRRRIVMDHGRKLISSCVSTYCTCLVRCFIHTLRMSVLQPISRPSNTVASVLYEILGDIRTIFMKLLRISLAKPTSLCY